MLELKVLGPGCANCRKLEATARQAAAEAGIEVAVTKVSAMQEIMAWDVMTTPGLVIGDRLVSSGRIPTQAEIRGWLQEAAAGAGS